MGNGIFRSEIGSGFGDAGGTPPPKISTSTPPGGTSQGSPVHRGIVHPSNRRLSKPQTAFVFSLKPKPSTIIITPDLQ